MTILASDANFFGTKAFRAFLACLLVVGLSVPFPAIAQNSSRTPRFYGPESKEALEAFLDDYLKKEMEQEHIPGFMISFVKDGQLLLNKGYGLADLEKSIPVDPQSTLMGVGSLGKPVTATAIMKLVDEGKVDLNQDVNTYFKGFSLKNDTGKTITVEQLLLHTAGFEDNRSTYATKDLAKRMPLGDYLKQHQPAVVYEPGSVQLYSNYSYTSLGYIIESVTGKSFYDYIEEDLLRPLNMGHSSFRQIPDLPDQLAKAYSYNEDTHSYEEVEQAYWYLYPAGTLLTNTEELSHFMLLQLNGGRHDNQQIVSQQAIQQMQKESFIPHPDLGGKAYGFSHWPLNGHKTLQKSGGGSGWSAHMVLFPEYGHGIAYAYNTENGTFSDNFRQALADRFYPSISTKKPKIMLSQQELKAFEGYYRYVQHSHTTLEKLMTAISPQFNEKVVANDDGTISVGVMFVSQMIKYEPISPTSFQKVQGEKPIEIPGMTLDLGDRIAFQKDEHGNIEYLFVPYEDIAAMRISSFEYGLTQLILSATLGLIALVFIVYWLVGGAIQWLRKKKATSSRVQTMAGWSGCLSAFLILLFFATLFTQLDDSIVYGIPGVIKAVLVIPILSIVLFCAAAVFTAQAWRQKFWSLPTRILYTLFTVTQFMFILWAGYYNLIGWRY